MVDRLIGSQVRGTCLGGCCHLKRAVSEIIRSENAVCA